MIFYFSATGNSQWVAQYLSKAFNEPTCSVTDLLHVQAPDEISYLIQNQSEMLFFVFPVHSWGPAIVMRRFIRQLQLSGWRENRVFAVCTCGDDCGYTDRIVRKDLADKGITLEAFFSVKMPNNYILMRGFGIDSESVQEEKLALAPHVMEQIVHTIQKQFRFFYSPGRNVVVENLCGLSGFSMFCRGQTSVQGNRYLYFMRLVRPDMSNRNNCDGEG